MEVLALHAQPQLPAEDGELGLHRWLRDPKHARHIVGIPPE